jgi:hypothetical protein
MCSSILRFYVPLFVDTYFILYLSCSFPKGECGTCTTTVAGVKIRACIGKVPPAPRLKSLMEKGLAVAVDNAR